MNDINIVIVTGIRPQYIKLAALIKALNSFNNRNDIQINAINVDIGQHYDYNLSQIFHDEFNLQFDYKILHNFIDPINILANSLVEFDKIIKTIQHEIDWIIVFGDGTPALVGAIIAARNNIPLAHIEAGVNRSLSEPEGINRKIADSLSTVFFCTTPDAIEHLKTEGIEKNVYWVGDLSYEFIKEYSMHLPAYFPNSNLDSYILASIHRTENLNCEVLSQIFSALDKAIRPVIFIAHPRTKFFLDTYNLLKYKNIKIIEPMSYKDTISSIKGCAYLMTDSGGLIREAYHLEKRCIVRRNFAGWSLLIDNEINKRSTSNVIDLINAIKWAEANYNKPIQKINGITLNGATDFVFNTLFDITREKKENQCR
jgi:UDP-GlcNAc3NAcA epimerase